MDYAYSSSFEPSSVFQPDILVNPQFYQANRRANPPQPERALLFAVLSEAIETFQKCASSQSPKRQALFREAQAWIWDEESDYLMSFKKICHLMGLDPAFLKRGLVEWRGKKAQQTRNGGWKRLVGKKPSCRRRSIAHAARPSAMRFRRPRLKGGWLM